MKHLRLFAAGLCLLSALGCGKKATLTRLPVSGKVTFQGAPLDNGTIQFMPPETGGSEFGGGADIVHGEYSLPQPQGLPPGNYKVSISAAGAGQSVAEGELPGESGPEAEERIPAEYNVNSDKVVEISADKENVFNFDIP